MSSVVHTEDGRGSLSHLHRKGLRDRTHFPTGDKDSVRNNKYSGSSNNRNNRHLDRQGKRKPQSQVRRTLAFDTDDENDEDLYKGGLDFTDKIAAFRALIKPMKDPVSILKSKRDLDQLKDERKSKVNSNTFTVDIRQDTEVRVSKNEDDTARAKRSLLSRKVDKELSRMSFINYQAHEHMMENGTGQSTNEGQGTPRHHAQNSVNKNASVSKILDEYLEHHDKKKRCQNFSEGLEGVADGEVGRNMKPSSRKEDRHTECFDVELKIKNKRRISQCNLELDLDLIQTDRIDHCDNNKLKSSQKAQTNLSIGSDPLSDVGSLLNKDGGLKGLKTVQSNVPHYHPAWCSQDKETGQRSAGPVSPRRQVSPGVPKTDSNAENFDVHYNIKTKFGSSHEEDIKYQTNVHNFEDSFNTRKSDKRRERSPRRKFSPEKDFTDLPKRSKSGGRHCNGFKSKHYQQNSRSPGRNRKSDFWDNFMSDSSKENIPDSDVDIEDIEDKIRKQKRKDRQSSTRRNIPNEKNGWKELGNSRERHNHRKKDKHAKDRDYNGLSDESLQIIPERDVSKDPSTQLSKMASKPTPKKYQEALESRVSDTSLSGSVWSSGSQSSVIQAAELIKRLYSADANTREELILKARFFRRWLKLVRRNRNGFHGNHTTDQEGLNVTNFAKSSSHKEHLSRSQKYADSPDNLTHKSSGLSNPNTRPAKRFHSTPRDGHLTGSWGYRVQNGEDMFVDDNNDTEFKVIEDKVTSKADIDIASDNHNLAHTRLLHIENFLEDALQEFKKNSADDKLLNGVENKKSGEIIKESGSELEEKIHASVVAQQNSENIKTADPSRKNSVSSKDGKAKKKKRNASLDRLLKFDNQSVKSDKQKYSHDQRQNNGVLDLCVSDGAPVVGEVVAGENTLSNSQPSSLIRQRLGGKFIKIQKKKRDSTTSAPVQVTTPIDSDQQLLDTANYGVCLQRAEIFLRDRLLKIYFKMWKNRAMAKLAERQAEALHRYHSLRKGMKAFSWAISRSRIQVDILQSRMTSIVLAARFTHWKTLAKKNRHERLLTSFNRWQCFTLESQKVRKLRYQGDRKTLRGALTQWRSQFITRLKENKADLHFRRTLLTEQLQCWKLFTSDSKEKKQRIDTARLFFSQHLQNKMFVQMVMVFSKSSMAKSHHRKRTLHMVLVAWRQASHVCKVERQRDMSISREHWRMATTKQVFCHWHDELLVQRTRGHKNRQIIQNAFHIWRVEWTRLLAARLENEARLRHEILTTALQLWRSNVELLQRRRQAGIIHLQRALVRHALLEWRAYTQHRKELRYIDTV